MPASTRLTRRTLLRSTGALAGGRPVHRYTFGLDAAQAPAAAAAKAPASTDALDARRAEMAKTPIARTRLADRLELLAGPGGNVVVLHGPDGLLLVDTFVRPAWPQLEGRARRDRRTDPDGRSTRTGTSITPTTTPACIAPAPPSSPTPTPRRGCRSRTTSSACTWIRSRPTRCRP